MFYLFVLSCKISLSTCVPLPLFEDPVRPRCASIWHLVVFQRSNRLPGNAFSWPTAAISLKISTGALIGMLILIGQRRVTILHH